MPYKLPLLSMLIPGLILWYLTSCATLGVPSEAQIAFDRGVALFQQGRYADAVPHFQRAAELDANFAQAYLYLGRAYLSLGQWLQAIPPIRTAFRLAPEESKQEVTQLLLDALLGGATAALNAGHFGSSIGLLREALVLAPQHPEVQPQLVTALIGLGGQFLTQGKFPDAITTFTEATHLSPQHVEAYIGLARALWQHGNLLQALTVANTALNLAPQNSNIRALLQQLQGR